MLYTPIHYVLRATCYFVLYTLYILFRSIDNILPSPEYIIHIIHIISPTPSITLIIFSYIISAPSILHSYWIYLKYIISPTPCVHFTPKNQHSYYFTLYLSSYLHTSFSLSILYPLMSLPQTL